MAKTKNFKVMYPEKQRSNWWYILPILFGIIGGIIAYFAIRKDRHKIIESDLLEAIKNRG